MKTLKVVAALAALLLTAAAFAVYERTETSQIGADGVAMQITESESRLAQRLADNEVPPALPPAPEGGALAAEEYENVHVLGHLTTGQFTRLMTAITTWVAPEQGCAYCHNTNNLASDELYPKVVSRRMLQMTMHINENWQQHVGETGVTCWTCHRGQNVPEYIWFEQSPEHLRGMLGYRAHQNAPSTVVGLSSLPGDPFETFLQDDSHNIRVQSGQPLPGGNRSSIKQTEWTYGLMMHFSTSLGVNCTFCHNSRSWADWSQSPMPRHNAWFGIRMVRQLNDVYLGSLADVFPENRLGPTGDVPKTNCMTCHQGAYRPLLGQSMLGDYPTLARAVAQPVVEDALELDDGLEDDWMDEILEEPVDASADQDEQAAPAPAPAPGATPEPEEEEADTPE